MYEHVEPETGQHGVLELWILVHDDGHDAHVREEAPGSPDHVLLRQPILQKMELSRIDHTKWFRVPPLTCPGA